MKTVPKISRGQLVSLLLTSRLSGCLLFSSDSFERFTLMECVWAMVLNGAFLFLLFLPTLWVLKKERGTAETAYTIAPAFGKTVDGAYILLCLFVLGLDMVQFSDFAVKTMKNGFSVPVLTVLFIGTCLLSSFYGIQALARSSTVVMIFSVLCLVLFTLSLAPEMKGVNFPPQQGDAISRIVKKAVADLPRSAEVVSIGLLYPYVNRSHTAACAGFAGATSFFSAAVSVTAVAVLGDFSGMTVYPYYAAVTAARLGVFQQLDILVTAVWLGTFFIRFTLFCMLLLECSRRLFGQKAATPTGWAVFILLTIVALMMQNGSYQGEWAFITRMYWWVLGAFCLALPLVLWGGRRYREKQ